MTVRIKSLLANLVIFSGIFFCSINLSYTQEVERKVKKIRQTSEKKTLRQSTKISKKRRKHAYKIQDRPTRKRMRKTYKNAMRRQKGKRSKFNRHV